MKTYIKFLFVLFVIPLVLTTGCKEEVTETDFDVLTAYAADNNLDLSDVLNGWVTSGGGLTIDADGAVEGYYVMDFRSATDFDAGHIKNAVNVSLSTMLEEATNAGDLPILCVCYTGQTAARATGLLRMAGYTNTKSLKWGMSCWNDNFAGKWDNNAKDQNHENWVTTGEPTAVAEFAAPDFSTTGVEGAEILTERIDEVIGMDWTITNTDVLGNPANYFINNKWSVDSWNEFGHIDGAYRIDVGDGLGIDGLNMLSPDETMVTYCYTGQTSAITTVWLQVMGYDNARSLLFGANAIVWSDLKNGSAAGKSWRGEGSGSAYNLPYYDKDGNKYE